MGRYAPERAAPAKRSGEGDEGFRSLEQDVIDKSAVINVSAIRNGRKEFSAGLSSLALGRSAGCEERN